MPTNKVYLALGSNIGAREAILEQALQLIQQRIGDIAKQSSWYHTAPEDFASDNEFINGAVLVHTSLTALQVLCISQQIEKELGRMQKSQNGIHADRTIDIDLLYFNNEQINLPELTIPHPRLHQRYFVLAPLCDIAPTFKHPIIGKNTQTMLAAFLEQEHDD